MPRRKAIRNSHHGCLQCKRRGVKVYLISMISMVLRVDSINDGSSVMRRDRYALNVKTASMPAAMVLLGLGSGRILLSPDATPQSIQGCFLAQSYQR